MHTVQLLSYTGVYRKEIVKWKMNVFIMNLFIVENDRILVHRELFKTFLRVVSVNEFGTNFLAPWYSAPFCGWSSKSSSRFFWERSLRECPDVSCPEKDERERHRRGGEEIGTNRQRDSSALTCDNPTELSHFLWRKERRLCLSTRKGRGPLTLTNLDCFAQQDTRLWNPRVSAS